MRSRTTQKFRALYDTLPKAIQAKATSAYELWSASPDHPSLRFKKVHAKLPIYSVRIDIDWRALGLLEGGFPRRLVPRLEEALPTLQPRTLVQIGA